MKLALALVSILSVASAVSAGEALFTSGPQEFGGHKYYWLAEWKLEVTLPDDVAVDDRLEVLFGAKGSDKRTLSFQYDAQQGALSEVAQPPYQWIEVPVRQLSGGKKVLLFSAGREPVAFLAGVRITGKSTSAPSVKPIPTATALQSGDAAVVWAELSGFEANGDAQRLWNPAPIEPDWKRAERSSQYAGIALSKVQRWLHERCLAVRDQPSGLFRPTGRQWNYQDTAADCYPFYVWAAYYTDQKILETVMLDVLEAEQRLCNHLDRLPVPYDMDAGHKDIIPLDAMIFGASEYAKDGLTPIVEITGKKYPWYDRLRGLVDDIFKHAKIDTPYGTIPSTNVEVNGELLQMLPRLYCMTGEQKYLDWAHRLADYYLLDGKFVPTRLSDHGCEIIGGLGLLFAVDATAYPDKVEQYKPHMEHMFDEILRRGRNSDGVIIGTLQDADGPHDDVTLRDGWGYDFVGFLDYDLALGTQRCHAAIRQPMANLLKPRYRDFNWDSNSRDNIADSVEGGLYLPRHFPTVESFVWADREIATLLVDHTAPDRLWDTHKLEANTVRTVLIHTMLHTRNTIARPWQPGLQLGAAPCGDGICIYLQADKAYEGQLQFDIPRHRLYMGFNQDWPRMNAVPEWFTVEPDDSHKYEVTDVDAETVRQVTGKSLADGLPIRLQRNKPLRLIVRPQA
jgi:hypothetical protein